MGAGAAADFKVGVQNRKLRISPSQLGLHVSWQNTKIQNLGASESTPCLQFAATRWKK